MIVSTSGNSDPARISFRMSRTESLENLAPLCGKSTFAGSFVGDFVADVINNSAVGLGWPTTPIGA
jgi:hypothetical protein